MLLMSLLFSRSHYYSFYGCQILHQFVCYHVIPLLNKPLTPNKVKWFTSLWKSLRCVDMSYKMFLKVTHYLDAVPCKKHWLNYSSTKHLSYSFYQIIDQTSNVTNLCLKRVLFFVRGQQSLHRWRSSNFAWAAFDKEVYDPSTVCYYLFSEWCLRESGGGKKTENRFWQWTNENEKRNRKGGKGERTDRLRKTASVNLQCGRLGDLERRTVGVWGWTEEGISTHSVCFWLKSFLYYIILQVRKWCKWKLFEWNT